MPGDDPTDRYMTDPFEAEAYWLIARPDMSGVATFHNDDSSIERVMFFEREEDARRFADMESTPPDIRGHVLRLTADECLTFIEGNDLTVRARLAGRIPEYGLCVLHVVRGRSTRSFPMTPGPGNRFEKRVAAVHRPLTFHVTAGRGRSAFYRVALKPRPAIVSANFSSATYSFVDVETPHASVIRLRSDARLAIIAAAGLAGSGVGMSISA